jgi:hypothetical protein
MEFGSPSSHDVSSAADSQYASTGVGAGRQILREHLLLERSATGPFGDWIDGQLELLEEKLSDFCTPKSIKG